MYYLYIYINNIEGSRPAISLNVVVERVLFIVPMPRTGVFERVENTISRIVAIFFFV